MGGDARHVCSRVGRRGGHRRLGRDGLVARHGSRYGLCQIYRNEPWHYELRSTAVDHGCPPMYADAAHDPRLQQ